MRFTTLAAIIALLFVTAACSDKAETDEPSVAVVSEGQKIWQKNCAVCHQQGLAGAPPIGNKALWSGRIAQGMDVLFEHAKNGYSGETGEMPARGGNAQLSDQDLELAVIYMVNKSK